MSRCPLYNDQSLSFTGRENPYALIQKGGKRRSKKTRRTRNKTRRTKNKTRRTKK